jgi:ABC-type glycerol-3-phosphate transport system substrate-binding protein
MHGMTDHSRRSTRRAVLGILTGLAGSVALAACGASAATATNSAGSASVASATGSGPASTAASAATSAPSAATVAATASGGTSTGSTVNSAVATTVTASSAGAVAASSAAPAPGVVTITHLDWWQPNTPVLVTFFNGNKADFEAKYPKVKVNYIYGAAVTDVQQKWIVTAAGGVPPDTSQLSVTFTRDLMKHTTLLEPLDAYIAKAPDMAMSNFVATGLYYNQMNGHTYGIPFDGPQMLAIAYNVDHFKEAGIDPSKNFTWKWTTEQFLDTANKLNRTQGGKTVRGGMQPFGIEPRGYAAWLYANGGAFYNKDGTQTLINSPASRNALQLCQDIWFKYPFQVANDTSASPDDHGLGGFEKGVYSMTYSGFYTAGYINDASPQLKYGFAPLPQGPLAKSTGSSSWTNMYGMSSGGKQKDAAWEWVSSVNSEAAQEKYFAQVQSRPSARKAVYQSAAWAAVVKAQPAMDGIETLVPESGIFPWIAFTKVSTDTGPIWKKVQANQLSVNDALNQMEPIIDKDITGQ